MYVRASFKEGALLCANKKECVQRTSPTETLFPMGEGSLNHNVITKQAL